MNVLRKALVLSTLSLLPLTAVAGSIFGFDKKPVPDWGIEANKTPTPEYAKDSAAVILYDEYVETIDGSGRAVEREREAIRILKPQGREDAVCGVSYDVDEKINYFRVWTIAADGRQYTTQDTDFADVGDLDVPIMLSTAKRRYVHVPAAEVGATVICESEEVMAPYMHEKSWHIQAHIPIVYEALELDLPTGTPHVATWHHYKEIQPTEVAPNHWRWELKNVHGIDMRDIPSRPDGAALRARMYAHWGETAVEGKENQWRAIGQWWTKLEEHRPDPTPEITVQAQALTAGATDFYSKLKGITEYIQKNIRYFVVERGIGGSQAHPAADIFRNRYGDCKDKATIVISMLQVVGIHADYVLVDDRRGVVDPDAPAGFGNHMISAIEIPDTVKDTRLKAVVTAKNGKRYLIFDPTDERTPVGNLRTDLQGSYGLISAGAESQVIELPVLAPDTNGSEQVGHFQLTANGTLSGSVDSTHVGPTGAEWRGLIKYTEKKERTEWMEKSLTHDIPGVALDDLQFVEPSDLDKPLEMHFKVTAQNYARAAGPLLLVRPRVVGDYTQEFDSKPRKLPIALNEIGQWHDSFDIKIPDGWVVDDMPDPVNLDMDFASYHSKVSSKGNLLHYEREFKVSKVELPAERASDFRRLEGNILADQKSAVVLKKQ